MALLVAHELLTEQRQGGGDRQKIIFSSCVRPVLVVSRLYIRSRPRSVHTTPEEFENEALFPRLASNDQGKQRTEILGTSLG